MSDSTSVLSSGTHFVITLSITVIYGLIHYCKISGSLVKDAHEDYSFEISQERLPHLYRN